MDVIEKKKELELSFIEKMSCKVHCETKDDKKDEEFDDTDIVSRYNCLKKDSGKTIRRNICCVNGKIVVANNQTLIELDMRKL